MKILFVPWGRGMGHITRCLAIAAESTRRKGGDKVYVLAEEQLDTFVGSRGCTRVSYPQELMSPGPWEGWGNIDRIRNSLRADLHILDEVQPDIVVHDRHPTLPIACELTGTPCTWLAQHCDIPGFFFSTGNLQSFWACHTDSCDQVMRENGLQPTGGDWRNLFFRSPALIPSIPEFEQFPEEMPGKQASYVGPLILDANDYLYPTFERKPGVPTIFVYGVIRDQYDLDQLLDCFRNVSVHLIITGLPRNVQIPTQFSSSIEVSTYPFVSVFEFLPRCDAAIIHGGHGSCMTVLSLGVPAVVLLNPREPEPEYNGKRLEEMGIARCITWNTVKDDLCREIQCVTQEPIYRENAREWQRAMQQWNGPETVYEILTTLSK